MLDLIAAYWMWMAAALLAGAAVGYRLWTRQLAEGGFRHRAVWGTAACLAGLAAAVLHGFPPRAEFDLQIPLWLVCAFAIGGLLGGWLRAATERAELRRVALENHMRVEAAVLGARAKAAVRSDQSLAAQDLAAQDLAAQDLAAQDLAAQDLAAQDSAKQDSAEQDSAKQDSAKQDSAVSAQVTEVAHLDVEAKAAEKSAEKTAEASRLVGAAEVAKGECLVTEAKVDNSEERLDPVAAEMMLGKSLPEQVAPIAGKRKHPGRRPPGIATALGKADDLKRIRGIGPRNAGRLHQLGIWHFSQIAAWTDDNVKWVGSYLAFSGRIYREDWVAQARELASGKETNKEANGETGKEAESSPHVVAVKIATSKDLVASKDLGSPGEGGILPLK